MLALVSSSMTVGDENLSPQPAGKSAGMNGKNSATAISCCTKKGNRRNVIGNAITQGEYMESNRQRGKPPRYDWVITVIETVTYGNRRDDAITPG